MPVKEPTVWLGQHASPNVFQSASTAARLRVTLLGQGNTPQAPPRNVQRGRDFLGLAPPADPEAAARGEKVFAQACAFCHGPNATGAEGPDLLRSAIVLHDNKGETIAPFLRNGRPDKGMHLLSLI